MTRRGGPSVRVRRSSKTHFVQACITAVSFPDSLDELEGMVMEGDDRVGETNMDFLLGHPGDRGSWTAPRWMTSGDILFFYHTKSARGRVRRLLDEVLELGDGSTRGLSTLGRQIHRLLVRQLSTAETYGGTIFACARVSGRPRLETPSGVSEERHWGGRIYAPFEDLFQFPVPLPDRQFTEHVTLSPGGTLTPVHGSAFDGLREQLAASGTIPSYLARARPGRAGFRDLDATNWMEIVSSPETAFIDESQLRAYYADYLLRTIRDPRTQVHEECRCEQADGRLGFADYFVRIGGTWIPVETKLNVLAERDLPAQVGKYCGVSDFAPRRGQLHGPRSVIAAPVAIVIDAEGVYLVSPEGFRGCSPREPILERTKLSSRSIARLRDTVLNAIAS